MPKIDLNGDGIKTISRKTVKHTLTWIIINSQKISLG